MRYRFEYCQNENCIRMHCDVALPYYTGEGCQYKPLDSAFLPLVSDLSAIRGIESVSLGVIGRFVAQFTKGELFRWADIKPEIVRVFQERFCRDGQMMEA